MDDERRTQLIAQAAKQLDALSKKSVRQSLRDILKRLTGRVVSERDPVFWPAGMLLLGLLEAEDVEKETAVCRSYLASWISAGAPVHYTDDALAGYVLVRLYETTKDAHCRDAAERIYAFLLSAPKDEERSIIYHPEMNNRIIYADSAGMTALFLQAYGETFEDEEATALGALQLSNFAKNGMDDATGLPYHAYDLAQGKKLGIVGWGRAVGWLLMGSSLAKKENALSGLSKKTLAHLRTDGAFAWQLPAQDGPSDTSATGMIAWALLQSGEKDTASLKQMKGFLLSQIAQGNVVGALAECVDFGQYPQRYGTYPWGQGAALAALARFSSVDFSG